MTNQINITLPYPPTLNRAYATVRGRRILSVKGKQFKRDVLVLARCERIKKLEGDLRFTADFYRPRKTGDLDNVIKLTQDALQGIAFENDSQIIEIQARRFDDKNNPRVEVQIRQIEVGRESFDDVLRGFNDMPEKLQFRIIHELEGKLIEKVNQREREMFKKASDNAGI